MRFKKPFFVLFCLLSCLIGLSQTVSVSGTVKDSTDEPVAFANILVLQQQDSTAVTGTSSDENGNFHIDNIKPAPYILKTSFIGYKDKFTPLNLNTDVNDIAVVLEASVESLNEVELIVKRPTLKREADRLVFNVENTALSQGNLEEVLRSTPSVLVLDNTILVKNATPTVYINDRKVHLSSSELIQLLQGTSATNIKSVEVITNPSAKYDADSGVVLNIVMSKNLISGYNGSVFSNYTQGVFPKYSVGTSHYFKGDKTNLFFNYNYNKRKDDRVDVKHVFYPDEEWDTNLDRNTWSETHNLSFNFDYSLNEKSSLGLSGTGQFLPYNKRLTRGLTEIEPGSGPFDSFTSHNLSRDNKHNLGFDLDYHYNFNENSKLVFNAHYTNYDYRRKQNVNSTYYTSGSIIVDETAFNVNADQKTDIYTSQLDYNLTINDKASFSSGLKFSNVKTGSGILQNDIVNGEEVQNEDITNTFDYDEDVYAAFVDYKYNAEKFTFGAGLRAEQTKISGVSSNNTNSKQDYLEFFPTANLSLQISEKVNTYVNYKRSIQRPNYSSLNPFVYYLNDNTIVTGNPNLKPVFNNKYLIGASINNTFTFEAYYRKAENSIFELPKQDNNNNTITYTPTNINSTEEIGFDFETSLYITDKWYFYFGTSTYNYNDKGTIDGLSVQRDKWANYSIFQNNYSFLKDNSLSATLVITYIGENVQALQRVHTRWDTFFSVQKTLFKGKGSLSLSLSDLFNRQDYFVSTNFLDQHSTESTDLDTRYIKLGFRYKFGNTKLSTNQRSTSREEIDRLKKDH
jgi:outer membrane receptor protein involved in Fe transport